MRSKAPAEDVRRALSRVLKRPEEHDLRITLAEQQSARGKLRALFQDGRPPITAMTWFMCFCSMLAIYFLISWLPPLLRMVGIPTGLPIGAATAINNGGWLGGGVLGAAGATV